MISCCRKRKNDHHRWIIILRFLHFQIQIRLYTLYLWRTTQILFLTLLCIPPSTRVDLVLWNATSPAAQFQQRFLPFGAGRLFPCDATCKNWAFLCGGCLWDVDNDGGREEDEREEKLHFRCCDVTVFLFVRRLVFISRKIEELRILRTIFVGDGVYETRVDLSGFIPSLESCVLRSTRATCGRELTSSQKNGKDPWIESRMS